MSELHATTESPSSLPPVRRDADRALRIAQERIETAQRTADAVTSFHDAAGRIDAAKSELYRAGADRLTAIRQMRACSLTISDISDLTGLSQSRIQKLLRED